MPAESGDTRRNYMKDVYWKTWPDARKKLYGFSRYDKNLCAYLLGRIPNQSLMLDVAGGTGYPIAQFFENAGNTVCCTDISLDLLMKSIREDPRIATAVCDVERLGFRDGAFDVIYCFHSSWYFPDITKAIFEMTRVAKPGALITFDLMNLNNEAINRAFTTHLKETVGLGKVKRTAKNIGWAILRGARPILTGVVYETPTDPEVVYGYLRGMDLGFEVLARGDNDEIVKQESIGALGEFDRLIFIVQA